MVELRERYVDALVDGDPVAAARIVDGAVAAGADVRTLYLQVLQPALYEIGRRWENAELSIAQEHLATATTQSLMARLAERIGRGLVPRDRTALVACAEGELHALGPRMVADFLEGDGWEVLFVGALSPVASLAELARARSVDLVALSAALTARVPELHEAVGALRALSPAPLIAVGGQAFAGDSEGALRTGADLYAGDPESLLRQLGERA